MYFFPMLRLRISLLTGTVVDSREEGSDGEGSDQENEEAPTSKSTLTPVEFAKLVTFETRSRKTISKATFMFIAKKYIFVAFF